MTTRVGFVSFAFWLAPLVLCGQPSPGAQSSSSEAEDVPGRGVARISLTNGDVTVRRGDSDDVIAAAVNAPLVASDRVFTGIASRTELQLDGANRLRIAPESDLRLAEIEYRRYTVELGRGTLTWHVSRNSSADIDINTPSVSVRPTQPGDYRITVNADGTTEVTARTGAAEIYSPRGVEQVRRGKTTLVRGAKTEPEFQTIAELREDDWDRFNLSRDRELDRSGSRQYLADDVVGAEELDHNGTWVDSAPYGRVWQPRVAAGWSPYSQGRWTWLDYYGWSWVSYDQFGWAPFHYGSWFYQNSGWCWYPGPRIGRTWWRPAMVAWFGFGGAGVGFGNFGWVPLAPFEHFRPWYGRGFYGNQRTNIYNNIRVVNNYNIINNYRNARVDGGARAVEAGQFGRQGSRYDRVGEANLRSAGLMQGQLPATPARESLAFNDLRVNQGNVRGGYDGSFYNRRPAVAQERIPFAEQQRGIEQGARTFGGDPSVRGGGRSEPNQGRAEVAGQVDNGVRGARANQGDNAVRGENGWRRVGDRSIVSARPEVNDGARGGGTRGATGTARSPADGNGWRRFGEPSTRTSGSAETVPAAPSGRSGGIRGEAYGGGAGREIDPSTRGGNANPNSGGNGWRRFGEPAAPDAGSSRGSGEAIRGGREYGRTDTGRTGRTDTGRTDTGRTDITPGDTRFSDRTSGYGSVGDSVRGGRETYRQSPAIDSTNGTQPRNPDFPRQGNTGGYRDRSGGGSRSDSIRVNPPVVRDRSDFGGYSGPSPSEGRGGFRGGGRESSDPSRENGGGQYRSVPSYGGAAPNMGGGGGFGGMRGGGGNPGSNDTGGGMRGGGVSAPSGGNSGSSRGSEGGSTRNGGGRRSQ